ncbi:hypothetical protein TPHA_0J01920 [Tetrapisispora phaffii CBS 4417]|uniref:SWR1-complex protein 5 n=1 Tax=Tetrapisispora phaffii (strain ATCC 24235 / CBS 4417 / NBRC 1672 / NRRL Y-8282 / UCD 70-5) TaxID=1071381 RepID=G8BYS1_TETPH|nr:hypothetical protein TPHA_0J01920 [Tetrapisispora phaffii CBS 4417]CCE65013.1 hypothetical protein TPHA_0J01920 [Tetrapisispora phaffii CBS 4417]
MCRYIVLLYFIFDINRYRDKYTVKQNMAYDLKNKVVDDSDLNDEYNEEEDEDYDPNKVSTVDNITDGNVGEINDSESDEENENDYEESDKMNYSSIVSETGGLIRTRHAAKLEEEARKKYKYHHLQVEGLSAKTNDIWEELQNLSKERLNTTLSSKSVISENPDITDSTSELLGEEMIWIERSYKFADQVVNEKKQVLKSSAEAKEYLNNLKFQREKSAQNNKDEIKEKTENNTEVDHKDKEGLKLNLRRPLRRPPILELIIAGSLKPNLTTLEKSKLDWVTYVDKEGINAELSLHNKDGYLAKQDFLNRVEVKDNEKYKEFRKKQLAQQFEDSK